MSGRGRAEQDFMTVKHIYITFIISPLLGWPLPALPGASRANADMQAVSLFHCSGPAGEIKKDVALQSERKFISDQLGWSWKTCWDWNITQLLLATCSLSGTKGQVECCHGRKLE